MILILTQCFPSRLGGIESLVSNLALGLGKFEKVIVFADRHHIFYDAIFDNQNKDKILVRRVGGIKFFRRRKKIKEVKPFIESKQVKLVLADTWKSLELGIDYLNKKNIPVICLAHGNELLSNEKNKRRRIEKTLNKIAGMFSFAVWDNKNKKLYLARDRLGIKPLYWSLQNKIFYFGSQPKCFIENKFWKKKIEIKNILYYFQFGYIAPPNSVFERTYQVEPGNYLSIDFNGSCKIKRYWDINKKINKDKRVLKEEEYTEELKRLLNKVVSQHLISDVPLGSFLSGGIDSSTISLIMSQQKKNIETFALFMARFKKRDRLKKYLIKNGIEVKVHYPIPLHLQKPSKKLGYKKGNFPEAEKQAKELLTLPVHQYLNKKQINFIVKKIENFYNK